MKKLLWLLLLPLISFADDVRERPASPTSVIEDSICVPALDGQTCLHIDEDIANLVIEVLGEDGTQVALYDAGTELEDIATIGTYAAPSGSNVRVSPQGGATPDGPDLTQVMLADAVYAGENRITICISDGGVTIMDFCRTVEMVGTDALTTIDANVDLILADTGTDGVLLAAGAVDSTSVATDAIGADELAADGVDEIVDEMPMVAQRTTIDTLSTQVSFTITAGSSDDDAYNGCGIFITDASTATQKAWAGVQDYTGSSLTVTLDDDPAIFTMADTDIVEIVCMPAAAEFMNKTEILGTGIVSDKWTGTPP